MPQGTGFTRWHSEWLAKYAYTDEVDRPTTFEVLLYSNYADGIERDDDVEDIGSEPSDGNYTRWTGAFLEDLRIDDLWENRTSVHIDPHAEFDMTDVTGEVDTLGIVWEARLEKDIYEAWEEETEDDNPYNYGDEGFEEYYEENEHWSDDPDFDEEGVDPQPHLMVRIRLEDRFDLDRYVGETQVDGEWQIQSLF